MLLLGVGSVGSRIATSLAASGIRHLCLVDRDIFEPQNAVRHELGFTAFGFPKTEPMLRRLFQANPEANRHLKRLNCRIGGGTEEEESLLLREIADADLLINATGSEHASHWVEEICHDLGRTRIHASVTSGAWGGKVIRVIPKKSPRWVCQVQNPAPPLKPRDGPVLLAPGYAQPTFTGSMPEVSMLADLAASMCIETLLARSGLDYPGSHLRWHARDATGRPAPKIEILSPTPRPKCFLCDPPSKSPGTSS